MIEGKPVSRARMNGNPIRIGTLRILGVTRISIQLSPSPSTHMVDEPPSETHRADGFPRPRDRLQEEAPFLLESPDRVHTSDLHPIAAGRGKAGAKPAAQGKPGQDLQYLERAGNEAPGGLQAHEGENDGHLVGGAFS